MGGKLRALSVLIAALALLALIGCAVRDAAAQETSNELTELLEDVGEDYAKAYLSPLISGFGANQVSNLFSTAATPGKMRFSFGLKVMGAKIAEEDQTFRVVKQIELDERYLPAGDPRIGEPGTVEIAGPTVFGLDTEDDKGTIQAYYMGLPVGSLEGIQGLYETRTVPLAVPEFSVAGLSGFKATLRWLPKIDLGDIGDLKLLGLGVQYNINQHFPELPVDVAAGFFTQSLDVGESVETKATSFFLAASKNYAPAVVYAGLAVESSSMDVKYTFLEDPDDPASGEEVAFEMDGEQDFRFTVGGTLDVGVQLNLEAGMGTITTLSAGLMFGI